jgi:hypothetical protein
MYTLCRRDTFEASVSFFWQNEIGAIIGVIEAFCPRTPQCTVACEILNIASGVVFAVSLE